MPDEQRFKIKITTLGRAKIATALANNSQLGLTQMAVGDGAGVEVADRQPSAGDDAGNFPVSSFVKMSCETFDGKFAGTMSSWDTNSNYRCANMKITPAGGHQHTVTIPAHTAELCTSHAHTITLPAVISLSVGSGQSINHLPPYVTVYRWRRTA